MLSKRNYPTPIEEEKARLRQSPVWQSGLRQQDEGVSLSKEEINSHDTSKGNIPLSVLDAYVTKDEQDAFEYQNSQAKKELELINKKKLDDAEVQLNDLNKTTKGIINNPDNYIINNTGKKVLKPESLEVTEYLQHSKYKLAIEATQNEELDNVNNKIKTLQNKYKSKPSAIGGIIGDYIVHPIINLFTNPEKKMTSQEKIEYNQLINKRNTFYKPLADFYLQERIKDMNQLDIEINMPDISKTKKFELRMLKLRTIEASAELQDYLKDANGSDNITREFSREASVFPWIYNSMDYFIKEDLQKKEDSVGNINLTPDEQFRLGLYSKLDENETFLSDKQKWSYGFIKSTAHSVGFIKDIVVANTVTGGIASGLGFTAKGVGLAKGVKALKAGKDLVTAKKIANRAQLLANIGVETTTLAASIELENHLNPQYLNDQLMKGSYIERDDNGDIKNIYVKKGYHDYMTKTYSTIANNYKAEKEKLESKGNLTEEEQNHLEYYKIKLGEVNDLNEHSLAEELAMLKPVEGAEAELRGFGKMASERIAEVYTQGLLKGVGKLAIKTPVLGKYVTKAGNRLQNVNSAFKGTKVGRVYDAIGKGTRKLVTDGNGKSIVNSMPIEVVEEHVTAWMNSIQDLDPKEAIDQATSLQANIDIAAQTLLMTAGFGAISNVQTSSKLALNKLASKRIAEQENIVNRLRNSNRIVNEQSATGDMQIDNNHVSDFTAKQSDITKRRKEALTANTDETKVDAINKAFDAELKDYKTKSATTLVSEETKLAEMRMKPTYAGAGLVRAISGSKDASFQATKNYIDSRKATRTIIDKLRIANTNKEINDIVNFMTGSSGFRVYDVKNKIQELKDKGEHDKAKVLENTMFTKIVSDAFRGGVQDELESALKKLQKNTQLPATTQLAISKASENLSMMKKTYEKYKDNGNVGSIVNLALEKKLLKEGIAEIEIDRATLAPSVKEEIDAYKQTTPEHKDVDYDIATLFTREFTDLVEQEKYDNFIEGLLTYENTLIDDYVTLEHTKSQLQEQLPLSMRAFNEQINPSQETKNKQAFVKTLSERFSEVFNGKVEDEKATYNYNNELIETPELIDSIFDKLHKDAVGKTMEGKVSQETFDAYKQHYKNLLKRKQLSEKFKQLSETQQRINQKRTEETETTPIVPTTSIIVDTEAEDIFSDTINSALLDTASQFDDIDPDSQPIRHDIDPDEFKMMIENQYTPEQIKAITAFVKTTVEEIESKLGRKPTFREFMEQTFKYAKDKEQVRKIFKPSIIAWEANNYEKYVYDEVYNDLFNPFEVAVVKYLDSVTNMFEDTIAEPVGDVYSKSMEETEKLEEDVAKETATTVNYDEENNPITKSAVNDIDSKRTLNIQPKLGFSAINYKYKFENGKLTKVSTSSTLNVDNNSLIDFRDLLNPDLHKSGTTLNIEVADESLWSQIEVSNGKDEQGNTNTITFDKWVAQRETNNPNFRQSVEFKNKVPAFYTSDAGKRLAYVQDTDWYNPYNIANPLQTDSNPNTPNEVWLNYIDEGKLNTQELRENISKGLNKVTINKPVNGVFHVIPLELPKITIQEANPQAHIVVQRGSKLHTNFDTEFNKGVVINRNANSNEQFDSKSPSNGGTNGNTWYMVRIGFTTNDKGEEVESYEALAVLREVQDTEIETAKWAIAAHLVLNYGENVQDLRGTPYAMTLEQAKKIQKDVNTNMGYNLELPKDTINFTKTFFQTIVSSDVISSYRNVLFNSENADKIKDMIKQHSLLKSFDSSVKSIINIDNGIVTPLKMNYEQYLKSTLKTNIKSFDVDTTGKKPIYATMIQPIINIDYIPVIQQEVSPRQQAVNTVIEELKKEQEKDLPFDITKHVEYLNQLGVDINDFEESDMMIEDTSKLANIFKIAGNLNILQEKAIRTFIAHSIASKIPIDYKSKVSENKIRAEVKSDVDAILGKIKVQLSNAINAINKQDNSDGKYNSLIEAYSVTLKNLNDVQGNFNDIYDKGYADVQKQTQLTTIEEKEEEDRNDDVEMTVKALNKESIEESGKSKASYRLRRFLHSIPKYDINGKQETGYLGFPSYMSFNDVYNELTKVLAMGSEVISDYDTIIQKLKSSNSPFIKDILIKLSTADQQIKHELVYNFVRHSLSSKFAMFELVGSGTSMKVYDTNSNEAVRVIIKAWKNENKSSELYTDKGLFDKDYAQTLIDEFEEWSKDYKEVNQNELRVWLGKIGFAFQDASWKQLLENGLYNSNKQYTFNELYNSTSGGLFIPLVNYLKKQIASKEDVDYDTKADIFKDQNNVTKALALLEAKNNPNLIALSFRDSGKNISTQVPTKYVTDIVQDLKRSLSDDTNTLIEDLQSLSYSESSIMLDLLKTQSTFKSIFDISHVGLTAIKEKGDPSTNKSGITALSDMDYDLTVLTGFLDRKMEKLDTKRFGINMRVANMLMPTMSDKTTGLLLKTGVFDFLRDSSLIFNIDKDTNEITLGEEIKDLLYNQLVEPELKRIIKFHQDVKATNNKNYDNGAQIFHLIPAMNNIKDEKGIRLIEKLATLEDYNIEDLFEITESYQKDIYNLLEQVVKKEVNHKKEQWSAYTETNKMGEVYSRMFDTDYFKSVGKNPAKDYELGVYDYVLNSLIFNADVFKVFAGDIANFSQDKLYEEKEERILPYQMEDDNTYISINKQIGINLGKRLALLIAPGSKIANSHKEQYNQIFLEDSNDVTENAKYLISNFYGEEKLKQATPLLEKYEKSKEIVDMHEEGTVFLSPEELNIEKNNMIKMRIELSKLVPDLEPYFNIESTDAQEYTTIYEHLSILHRMGRISSSEYSVITNKLLAGEDLTKEGPNSELNLVFQPIKPVHTGNYINKDKDMNRLVYIKTSAFPLIPQLTAGTKLDNLRIKMEELEQNTGRFTRASYQTGNKVGSTVKTVNPFDVNSLEGVKEYEVNDVNSKVLVLDRKNFRIQQDVPFKSDKKQFDKVSMGTQFFKLLFGDGMMDINDYEIDGELMTGQQLYDYYNDAFSTIVDAKKKELFTTLGLTNKGTIKNKAEFIQKLQDLLIEEATKRGYSLKSLSGLRIEQLQAETGYYYDFKIPLWLSSDSNRYESLLNAIITNRIMKHKIQGNSFVAGSESGFRYKENLKGIDKSRIIYLNGWNGKQLQGTHTVNNEGDIQFQKAQVFAPSKFKNNANELVDLFEGFNNNGQISQGKYIERKEVNGKLTLIEGMIDKELLNNFTFRTPTSSHVSGSSVEIVGILPPEAGDLMIVPKNFTKQKGLDYDIDKESAYQLHHVVNHKSGKIQVYNEKFSASRFHVIDKLIEKLIENKEDILAETTNSVIELEDGLKISVSDAIAEYLNKEELDVINDKLLTSLQKKERLVNEENIRLSENKFIKAHLAVYNNANPIVQNKINRILSIKFAKEQADILEELNEKGIKNKTVNKYVEEGMSLLEASKRYDEESKHFTMLTYSYQKNKMSLGSIGQIAIGVYANYTTFSGLLQQNKTDDVYIKDTDGSPKSMTIGQFISDGMLNKTSTLDGSRSKAEAYEEKENTATDNEKEQVLGRVGVNDATINVDAHMLLRGFDKDEKGNSISYMLLSQPIIKEFNTKRKESRGILGKYITDEEILTDLITKYSKGVLKYVPSTVVGEKKFEGTIVDLQVIVQGIQGNVVSDNFINDASYGGSVLQGEALLDGIKYNGDNHIVQLAALKTYLNLEQEARVVSKVQKVVNTNILGKSIIESQIKYKALQKLPDNNVVANVHTLLGKFTKTQDVNQNNSVQIGEYYVTPNTPQGQIVINGLYIGNTIFKDFFPYEDKYINNVVKEILSIQGKEEDVADSTMIENFETIVEHIKKYIYSREGNNVFQGNPRSKRYELFIDDVHNTSLSTYLKNLIKDDNNGFRKGTKVVKQNTLIKSFNYETGKKVNEASLIKYNNAATDNVDEEDLYNSIPELVLANEKLPDRNGEPYNTVKLAEDLVAYTFLEGGIQEATQFVKFIPVEMLETMGKREKDGTIFIPVNKKLQSFNNNKNSSAEIFREILGVKGDDAVSIFTKQYFQHNPSKAPKLTAKDKKTDDKIESGMFKYKNKEGKSPLFVAMKNNKDKTKKYSLYQNVGNSTYQEIDVLGTMGMGEYHYLNEDTTSLMNNKVVKVEVLPENNNTNIPINKLNVTDKTTVNQLLNQISNLELAPEYAYLKEAARWLAPMSKNKGELILDKTLLGSGKAERQSLNITLNPINTLNVSDTKTAIVFLHEFIHTITVNELKQYFNNEGTELKANTNIPSYVTNLVTAFNEFRKIHDKEITELDRKIKTQRDNGTLDGEVYTDREKDIIYGGTNIFEFVTISLTSPAFQEEMNKIEYKKSGKTIWDKIKSIYMDLITKIYPNLVKDSLAEASVLASMDFITEETIKRQSMEAENQIPPDIQRDLDKEESNPIQYTTVKQDSVFEEDINSDNNDNQNEGDFDPDAENNDNSEGKIDLSIENQQKNSKFDSDRDPFNCR